MTNSVDNPSFFPTAVKHGLTIGVVLIILSLITNLFGLSKNLLVYLMLGLFSLCLYGAASYRAIKEHRDVNLSGQISFGQALITGLVAAVTAGLVTTIFMIVYVNFIDPSIIDQEIEMAANIMEFVNTDEDEIDRVISEAEQNAGDPIQMLKSGIGLSTFVGLFSSLILGAVMRKEKTLV